MRRKEIVHIIILFFLFAFTTNAQEQDTITTSQNARQTRVYLEHANTLSYNRDINPDAQILVGDVRFRHDSSYMFCDSAYFYELSNTLEAFSNVRMEQGDTLFVYGNYLLYDGNTQLANLRENVRMENGEVTLFTDSLNYDRLENIGYYFEGGLIVDEENELSSFYGQYSPSSKLAIFNNDVVLENPNFILYSDTLHYNTDTKVALILGPSVIESDSGTVYTSRGWYDTANELSLLLDRSRIVSGEKWLEGDSIVYNRGEGFAEAFGNMILQDTAQQVVLEGEYGFYNEKTEFAFATENARFLEYSQGDTLYLHADTLEMMTADSDYREIKAYHGVRFFRVDVQGVCDSMHFNTRDSVLYMIKDPIIWNDAYQLYGDTILIYMNDSTVDYAHVKQFAFAIQHVESSYYNQIKGNDLKAYFDGSVVRKIDVEGNAESIYYPLEDDGTMVGLNALKSGFLTMWLSENQLDKLVVWPTPQGVITPIPDLTPDQKTLKDFHWFEYLRPKDKDDIFTQVERNIQDAPPPRSNKFVY
ncbi:hypothetical protein LJC57_06855 [Parabacteroides sp. OttesenSCG-928-G07]|nr:hypothetical protein [Parabacteroides sp. OttesenSCG-928-G21]MDL2278297.1 hypothetical protein [Parabacteroides sp. OttesenSCG-928-G07]